VPIGGQDQSLLAGHVVQLGADVALAIEQQQPQQLTGGIEQLHRDDAYRAGADQRSEGHGGWVA
jgi:UDP:flavonoid glycosyltransferase YjiC (YdhE family)